MNFRGFIVNLMSIWGIFCCDRLHLLWWFVNLCALSTYGAFAWFECLFFITFSFSFPWRLFYSQWGYCALSVGVKRPSSMFFCFVFEFLSFFSLFLQREKKIFYFCVASYFISNLNTIVVLSSILIYLFSLS